MACFRRYPNVFVAARAKVNSGLWAKPAWFDGARRAPPPLNLRAPAPPRISIPEDDLFKIVIARKPMLELEIENPTEFRRSIAHRFALKQWRLMSEQKLSEEEAYNRVEEEFTPEIREFEAKLDEIHEDGAKKMSFNAIKNNMSAHSRISGTIGQLVEKRLDLEKGGPIIDDPINDTEDTPQRRRARVDRLQNDDALRRIKSLFRPSKPAALKALENLVLRPTSSDTAYWNNELRSYFVKLQSAVFSFEENKTSEATAQEVDQLKFNMGKVGYKVKREDFTKLDHETQKMVIEAVKAGLRLKLADEKDTLSPVKLSTTRQATIDQVRNLKEQLAQVDSSRSLKDIFGKEYEDYLEHEWWSNSKQRKQFLAEIARRNA